VPRVKLESDALTVTVVL